ncbi:MAG: ATP-binding cassette domain-containing protein [Candidatus Lokiarchaeota archaeon]|nr:ATP-binding cassette domain-containing protein [Candidatus Lokiarchaeota archaeon]
MSTNNSVITINDLKKYYGALKAVDGISLNIESGETYGLLGPNGAGKTTTVKCILGLLDYEGSIEVMGMDTLLQNIEVKKMIGYVSEEPLIYKSMTPQEMFSFLASVRKLDADKVQTIANELMESLEAMEFSDTPIAALSKGNKQKIQIIASLIHDPELLILDEPLAGLDARSSRVVKDIINIHTNQGGSVLLSTHVMEVAEGICDRIGILNRGILVAEGTMKDLRKISHEAGASSLEDVFLKITEQDESVKKVLKKLTNTLK